MRVLKEDQRAGTLKLQLDTLDDLWTLRNLLQEGDLATAETTRTMEQQEDLVRAGKAEKKHMVLGVRVQTVEFHDFADHLRVHGLIETGPQDHGKHHTLTLTDEPGTWIEIHKKGGLRQMHRDMVEEAVGATKRPQVILLAIDDSEAQFALLKSYGVQMLGSLPAGGQGKRFANKGAKEAFYDEALKSLAILRKDRTTPLLVVGPGWWREEFIDHAKTKAPELIQGALTDGTSQGGRAGVQEALRRGLVESVARDNRVAEETSKVEEVFTRIATDGLVAYGPDEVLRAVTMGAAEEVLVTDDHVRAGTHDEILHQADQTRCHVHVVATNHDAGARLAQIGGIGALLRFATG